MLWRVYPELRHIWLVDKEYQLPNFDDVVKVVEDSDIRNLTLHDCDDYSLHMHSHVRLRHERWAFGEIIGYLEEGIDIFVHAMNLVISAQGVYFYDAKEHAYYKPNEIDFKPFFVRM